ncbi:hypothetical protein Oweho_3457 [Owenweeksia hongkongensis DSM 17368]|uniref:Uncharacterized protein n=1 Tax=Owenweeksia hongkongensis (strain DSM 17368 / CIP 108786 / JCM 12287 / NRRL B-23963 / UST20020801) TaxID=926562 RepID=G8R6E3_OWEHD|nr:hypothetical protein [Owenweeksia hongkongensis]AEV34406.1 hypothetical protein Oweho_3457 [Owenweeksia hongkongensis DSM 17368]
MRKQHLLLIVPILLLLAFYSAFGRVGWDMPIPDIAAKHGFYMVSGLFGTLISLERTFILKNKLWLAVPLVSFASVILVITEFPLWGFLAQAVAAILLSFLYFIQWRRHKEVYLLILTLSGLAWMTSGLVLMTGKGFAAASIWLILFLLYTIVAERLELSKFVATPKWAKPALLILFILLFAVQAIPFHWGTNYPSGILIAATGFWLLQFDMATKNLNKSGFFFYTGSTLYTGFVWLMISGVLMALPLQTFYHYDAVLHSFFIGFAFSMIYAHAPIIFPALLKKHHTPFHKILYIPVWLIHVLLLLRLYADYSGDWTLRKWTGLLQVLVMLLFFTSFAVLMFRKKKAT